jgi:excisionase family DNA binding protein
MPRRLDHRRISKHRNYTVAEIATCLAVSRGTVRRWIKDGLPALDDRKPMLVLGSDLIAFLKARRKPRQKCGLGECYCFSCRAPRPAAGGVAEVWWDTPATGNLHALCAVCTTVMHKRVSATRLNELQTVLDVTIVQGREPISDSFLACSNDHFATEHEDHA